MNISWWEGAHSEEEQTIPWAARRLTDSFGLTQKPMLPLKEFDGSLEAWVHSEAEFARAEHRQEAEEQGEGGVRAYIGNTSTLLGFGPQDESITLSVQVDRPFRRVADRVRTAMFGRWKLFGPQRNAALVGFAREVALELDPLMLVSHETDLDLDMDEPNTAALAQQGINTYWVAGRDWPGWVTYISGELAPLAGGIDHILACPAVSAERVGSGVLLELTDGPVLEGGPERLDRWFEAIDHLGFPLIDPCFRAEWEAAGSPRPRVVRPPELQ